VKKPLYITKTAGINQAQLIGPDLTNHLTWPGIWTQNHASNSTHCGH